MHPPIPPGSAPVTVHDKLTRLPLFHLKSVMLDHFIAENATAHKVNSYCTVAISYCTFCVEKHYFRPCGRHRRRVRKSTTDDQSVTAERLLAYAACKAAKKELNYYRAVFENTYFTANIGATFLERSRKVKFLAGLILYYLFLCVSCLR